MITPPDDEDEDEEEEEEEEDDDEEDDEEEEDAPLDDEEDDEDEVDEEEDDEVEDEEPNTTVGSEPASMSIALRPASSGGSISSSLSTTGDPHAKRAEVKKIVAALFRMAHLPKDVRLYRSCRRIFVGQSGQCGDTRGQRAVSDLRDLFASPLRRHSPSCPCPTPSRENARSPDDTAKSKTGQGHGHEK